MPDITSVLKSEIVRIARKEVRTQTEGLKKSATSYRAEIAALKRRTQDLEQELRRLVKVAAKEAATTLTNEAEQRTFRFVAKGFASTRARLGLSAEDCGLLVGASSQSVYNWEKGEARPRAAHLPAIAALRTMGKKEAAARLSALRESA